LVGLSFSCNRFYKPRCLKSYLYNEGHQRNIIEKLKKLKITTFQTVEDIFKIEFPKSVAAQIDEKNKNNYALFEPEGIHFPWVDPRDEECYGYVKFFKRKGEIYLCLLIFHNAIHIYSEITR
jgi:hypothetical protein